MKSFSIKDIPEFSQKERMVVVGVIGKSPYRYPNKTTPLVASADCTENDIKCYWDERSSVLYLHAMTYLDTSMLTKLAAGLEEEEPTDQDIDSSNWLVAAGEVAIEACKTIALVFHLSHIVVLSSPTHVFDLGYLQLFKAIDSYRTKLSTFTKEALESSGATGYWQSHGRTCCPRLLFHFMKAPRQLKKSPAALKRLEHAIEDQLYFILRKARIITNICANSLFAIPKNEEFVHINADSESLSARDLSSLVRGLVNMCSNDIPIEPEERQTFKQFLNGHIELAFRDGFDDNVGKYAMSTSFFELPRCESWSLSARALQPLYLSDPSADSPPAVSALHDALATDVRFSQARCDKVLPIAHASYNEGLPAHYSSQHHELKVSTALSVLDSMARGPASGAARARLRAAAARTAAARRLCELPSLTQHGCVLPEHDNTKEHSSGVRFVSVCACGRSRMARDDPYSVRRANHSFYVTAAAQCGVCDTLTSVSFPVFQPSTPTYKAASVKSGAHTEECIEGEGCEGEGAGSASGAWTCSQRDSDQHRYDVMPIEGDAHAAAPEKGMRRQASTTEYLPGMLHTLSPSGLAPAYPSWSLIQLGGSSLYSHTAGLPEHLQPGFLHNTNFLLPWDCPSASRAEQSGWRGGRARGGKAATHLSVKIFYGYEYECPKGHRFIMSSPSTVVSGAASGATGSACAGAAMPVYVACVCRATRPATLAKLHVVTPKTPVYVTLHPKVQPVSNGPTFIPQPLSEPPIKLSSSAYWILRFPYIYSAERGPLPRPTTPQTSGRIVPPMFGLAY